MVCLSSQEKGEGHITGGVTWGTPGSVRRQREREKNRGKSFHCSFLRKNGRGSVSRLREDISTHRKNTSKSEPQPQWKLLLFQGQSANGWQKQKQNTWVEDCLEMEQPDKRIYFFIPTLSLFPHLSTMGERRHSGIVKSLLCSKGGWPPLLLPGNLLQRL